MKQILLAFSFVVMISPSNVVAVPKQFSEFATKNLKKNEYDQELTKLKLTLLQDEEYCYYTTFLGVSMPIEELDREKIAECLRAAYLKYNRAERKLSEEKKN